VADSGLEGLRDVVFIAPGDFDNDGLPDLCVITTKGAALYRSVKGKFHKHADVAAGSFRQAFWIDYDHEYDEDLILVGDDSRLMRNNGEAGFSDETKRFPFVAGHATGIARYEVNPDLIDEIENKGMIFSAKNDNRMEILELPTHKFFIGTQFHPEFKSRPERPAPVFLGFVKAMLSKQKPEAGTISAKAGKEPLRT